MLALASCHAERHVHHTFFRMAKQGQVMLELNSSAFLSAATSLARLHQIFSNLTDAYGEILIEQSISAMRPPLASFREEAERVGARLAVLAVDRMVEKLNAFPVVMTVAQAVVTLNEIESRFADHLLDIRMFALNLQEASLLESADALIAVEDFSVSFPNAAFEVEEAAKCLALGRHTAAVFHAMRMLEIGIAALSKRLGIPSPAKPAEKNWGLVLRAIQARVEELWPSKSRMPGSEGAEFEALYAHLDAVRNPWRNATMHVETIYAPHEAMHILRCAAFFMTKLHGLCDEEGISKQETGILHLEDATFNVES